MTVNQQIKEFISSIPEPKRSEVEEIHRMAVALIPKGKLWFFDGMDGENKMVANPTIGYGEHTIHYANGTSRDFFQIGLSPNKSGISVHILGLKDKTHLIHAYGKRIGKASLTGYSIRFKTIKDLDMEVLKEAMQFGFEASGLG